MRAMSQPLSRRGVARTPRSSTRCRKGRFSRKDHLDLQDGLCLHDPFVLGERDFRSGWGDAS